MVEDLEQQGFAIVPGVLSGEESATLGGVLGAMEGAGRRGVLAVPQISTLAASPAMRSLVHPHLRGEPKAERGIFFNKSPDANWLVPWHQDLTLALRSRAEVHGFGPWSVKDGIPHVQPPAEWLERMLTIRLHLDAADETNGALAVLPGTHRLGRLSPQQIQSLRHKMPEHLCRAKAGDVLLMRPLLLHSSRRSTTNRQRRVLHLEYAAFDLPNPLEWHERP